MHTKLAAYLTYGQKQAGVRDALNTLFTGRVNLYHGTSAPRAAQIAQQGLRPKVAPGISSTILGLDELEKNLAFTTRSKRQAGQYALRQAGLDRVDQLRQGAPRLYNAVRDATPEALRPMARRLGGVTLGMLPGGKQVVQASVPRDIVKATRANIPELNGSVMLEHRQIAPVGTQLVSEMYPRLAPIFQHPEAQAVAELGPMISATSMVPISGGIPSKFIRGAKNYQGVTREELQEHLRAARQDPRGLGKDVLRSLLGVQSRPSTVVRENPLPVKPE